MAKKTATKAKPKPKPKTPNILLIGVDSMLSTHMSCYGYHRQTTPHIGRFAEDGALFEQTISAVCRGTSVRNRPRQVLASKQSTRADRDQKQMRRERAQSLMICVG